MAIIRRIFLRRFRSFPAEKVELDNPVYIVGQNGAGKSNFTDAFAFLSEAMSMPLQAVFDTRGGITSVRNKSAARGYPPNLGIRVDFSNINGNIKGGSYGFEVKALKDYGFEVVQERCILKSNNGEKYFFNRTEKAFQSNIHGLKPAIDPSSLCLPLIGGSEQFAPIYKTIASIRKYAIQPSRLREMQDPDSGVSLKADGGNAASVLQELSRHEKASYDRIGEILSSIVPNTTSVKAKKHGNKLSLEFVQIWGKDAKGKAKTIDFEGFNMSDGTLRAVGLLVAIFQSPKPSVLVIEEPESTIHPGALGAILDMIRSASKNIQVIVTTHSPELLDEKEILDHQIRIVTWQDGASRVHLPSQATREAMRKHLMGAGELLRANALRPADPLYPRKDIPDQESLFEDWE